MYVAFSFFLLHLQKQPKKTMDILSTIIGSVAGALFGGGGVWLINMYTAPEKKKQGQINNLITIIESQDKTIQNLTARQEAYEERVNKRISETMQRAYKNEERAVKTEERLTRMENAVHRARLCKLPTRENPCPVLVYVDDETQKQHCEKCEHNN